MRRGRLQLALRYAAMLAVTVVFVFPIYWLFIAAFKTPEEIFASPPVWWPSEWALNYFVQILRDNDIRGIGNSLVVAGISSAIAMLLGTMAAYSLARFRTGGENLAMWVISQRMIPPITIVFPVFMLFAWAGLVDTYTGLVLLYTAFNLPYVIWMMRGYIEDVPRELEESALVDGCTRFQMLFRIVFPLVRGGFFATAVFTFIFAWNEFIFALVLTRTYIPTYPVILAGYFTPQFIQWGRIGALSLLASLPVFLVVALAQRYLARGISLGAVKG
jgi:multiple sugar transport system permease protein